MLIQGSAGHTQKKQRGAKYMASDKKGGHVHILIASDEGNVKKRWARTTGLKESECKVSPIGTQAEAMAEKRRGTVLAPILEDGKKSK